MADIYVVGSGILGYLQLTIEAQQALTASKKAFVLHDDRTVLKHLAGITEVIDVAWCYEGVALRREAYQKICDLVLGAARHGPTPVALVVHGHPLFLVSAVELIVDAGLREGLEVEVIAGVSSFDTVCADLRQDLGYAVQLFDAATMLSLGHAPNPKVPMLVFQLASALDDGVIVEPSLAGVQVLKAHLVETYGLSHPCAVVFSASHPFEKGEIRWGCLDTMEHLVDDLWRRPTLYVPACDSKQA